MKKVSYFENLTEPADSDCSIVALEELKAWLKIDGADEDNELSFILIVAQEKIGTYINQALLPYTVAGYFVDLQINQMEKYPFVSFKRFPVRTLTNVKVWDGTEYVAITASDYELKKRSYGFDRVVFQNGLSITSEPDTSYPIRIEAAVGYADADAVPAVIKMAIRQYAAYLYDNRGDCSECECDTDGLPSMPALVRAALKAYRLREAYA